MAAFICNSNLIYMFIHLNSQLLDAVHKSF